MKPRTVGIVGIGLLGGGIATCLLAKQIRVIAYDRAPQARQNARKYIQMAMEDLFEHKRVPRSSTSDWPGSYSDPASIEALRDCDYVIESVNEDLQLKRSVFDQLEAIVGSTVPIASNTSAFPISVLQKDRRFPSRFIGMHWADPCHIARFLEVIRGESTDDATADATLDLARAAGKDPSLVKKDVTGFIVNRINYAMYREAFNLLESGVADVETIDRSFRSAVGLWAAIGGPFRWMDLTGVSAYAAVMKRLFPTLSNSTEVPETIRKIVESGANGISTCKGFYDYTPEEVEQWEKLFIENVWFVQEMNQRAASIGKTKHD
jgi:3-hydroxybutyryl-CoA dehydrogenase